MTGPRPEAVHAAIWWASRLGCARHDLGGRDADERGKSALANFSAMLSGRVFTEEQRGAFRCELAVTIEEHLARWETESSEDAWRPDNPQWGSALRAFGCDYGPDPVLEEAAERAGFTLRSSDLPMKTVMWINPGQVKVAEGYSALPEVIWEHSGTGGADQGG